MSDDEPVLLRPDKNQRTLFSLSKVVRMDNTSMCFTLEEIRAMKAELLVATQTKHQVRTFISFFAAVGSLIFDRLFKYVFINFMQLLITLRKLDCYKLQVEDLRNTDIGSAVSTLAQRHPKLDVSQLASRILTKWRDLVETSLFKTTEYDVEAADAAEDGEAVAPEDLIAAEKEQQRLEKLERRRLRIEEDFMAVSDSDEEMSDAPSQDPEWAPSLRKSQQSQQTAKNPLNMRRSRSGRAAVAERLEKEKAEKEKEAADATVSVDVIDMSTEQKDVDKDMKDTYVEVVEVVAATRDVGEEKEEKEGENPNKISDGGGAPVEEQPPASVAKEDAELPAAPAAAPESQSGSASLVTKTPKPRLTILQMLQKQAANAQATPTATTS